MSKATRIKQTKEENKQRVKDFLRWKNDPIAFIEECCYLPEAGEDKKVKLYDPQKRIIRSFYEDHYLILLKSRQIGMSTLCKLVAAHLTIFYDNVKVGVLSKDREASSSFCRDVQSFISKIKPSWVVPKFTLEQAKQYKFSNGSSLVSAGVAAAKPDATFRSETLTVLFLDEAAFIDKIGDVWTSVGPALSKAQQVAENNGVPYGTIVLSTPNGITGRGQWYYQSWNSAVQEPDGLWKAHKIHWSEIDDFAKDPEWIKKQHRIQNNDPRKIAQELELKFISSGDTVFSEEVQIALQEVTKELPKDRITLPEGGELWRFSSYNINDFFLIAVDPASGTGADFSAVQVINYETMEQIMEYKGKIPLSSFANVVKTIARMIPNNSIIVENTGGYGSSILISLMEDTKHSYNVFEGTISSGKTETTKPGLSTNAKTRKLYLDALFEIVNTDPTIIKSNRLADELLSLTNKNGRIEAQSGFHDDLALAYSFVCYVRQYERKHMPLINSEDREMMAKSVEYISKLNSTDMYTDIDEIKDLDHLNSIILKNIKTNLINNKKASYNMIEEVYGKNVMETLKMLNTSG